MKSEFLNIAFQILEREQRPMHPKEIVSLAIKNGLFSDKRAGKTPHQTMKAKLSVHIRRKGSNSVFVRTAPGKFYLRHLVNARQKLYEAKPLLKPHSKENVLVFPNDWFNNRTRFQGISKWWKQFHKELLQAKVCTYMDRLSAENDNHHKQILTYIMVTKRGRVLAYKRGNFNRVEDFLRGSNCIGFGGHVIEEDLTLFGMSDMGLRWSVVRELSEELKLPDLDLRRLETGKGLSIVGVLNDDSSIVGQRHFAFVLRYEVSKDLFWERPERGEKSITQLRWLSKNSRNLSIWNFEYWSQLCLREFFKPLALAAPTYRILRRRPLKPPHILCVLGSVGSGKSEAATVMCREFGYKEINTGKLVASILGLPAIPATPREVIQVKAWEFIQTPDGPERLAKAIWNKALKLDGMSILINGIRQRRTIAKLRELAGNDRVGLLFVHTPTDLAYKFYKDRESPDLSIFDFLKLRSAPVEGEVEGMIESSDAVLYNWTGKGRYQQAVRSLMREITS